MTRALSDTRPQPRRGLSREEAAVYIGVSPGKFDKLIANHRMPRARCIDGRKVWDVRELDWRPRHGRGRLGRLRT